MKYIFDTNTLSNIFNHYYFDRFPSFWEKFNNLIQEGELLSVREARKEIEEKAWGDVLLNWVKVNNIFFHEPSVDELKFITQIYNVKHFQQNLENKKMLKGGAFADPFLIAKAYMLRGTVITEEKFKKNAAKIPNICEHFNINCIDFEGFLIEKDWKF